MGFAPSKTRTTDWHVWGSLFCTSKLYWPGFRVSKIFKSCHAQQHRIVVSSVGTLRLRCGARSRDTIDEALDIYFLSCTFKIKIKQSPDFPIILMDIQLAPFWSWFQDTSKLSRGSWTVDCLVLRTTLSFHKTSDAFGPTKVFKNCGRSTIRSRAPGSFRSRVSQSQAIGQKLWWPFSRTRPAEGAIRCWRQGVVKRYNKSTFHVPQIWRAWNIQTCFRGLY